MLPSCIDPMRFQIVFSLNHHEDSNDMDNDNPRLPKHVFSSLPTLTYTEGISASVHSEDGCKTMVHLSNQIQRVLCSGVSKVSYQPLISRPLRTLKACPPACIARMGCEVVRLRVCANVVRCCVQECPRFRINHSSRKASNSTVNVVFCVVHPYV